MNSLIYRPYNGVIEGMGADTFWARQTGDHCHSTTDLFESTGDLMSRSTKDIETLSRFWIILVYHSIKEEKIYIYILTGGSAVPCSTVRANCTATHRPLRWPRQRSWMLTMRDSSYLQWAQQPLQPQTSLALRIINKPLGPLFVLQCQFRWMSRLVLLITAWWTRRWLARTFTWPFKVFSSWPSTPVGSSTRSA